VKAISTVLATLVVAAGFLATTGAWAQPKILTEPPENPDPNARYVFYLHGKIIEDEGRRPTHPRWGVYEYDAILEALASKGYVVISEQRPVDTIVGPYSREIKGQIRDLIKAGVPFDRITVVGFSKGGNILQSISKTMKAPIRYVIMAGCSKTGKGAQFQGNVLSLVEKNDYLVGICMPLFEKSPRIGRHQEIIVDIGGGHGSFFKPDDRWLDPAAEWIEAPPPSDESEDAE